MKILQLVQKPQRRGAEVFAFQLSAELRAVGHIVTTTYLYPYQGDAPLSILANDHTLDGHERHLFEMAPGFHPKLLDQLSRIIQEFEPDVIQVNGARSVKYGAFAKRRAAGHWKLVYRNIDNPAYWVTDSLRRWFYKNLVMPQLDGVIGVSQITLESVRQVYGVKIPAVYIPNGIAMESLRGLPTRESARCQLGIEHEGPVLLFIGSLSQQKRPDRFISIVASVWKHDSNVRAWILGGGPLLKQLEDQVQREGLHDIVSFWGYQEQVGRYIVAADLLLVTSDSDGIPAVVLEAGYLGKPVVATRVGGMVECVLDGETGLLVEPDDELGQARAVMHLLADEPARNRMGRQAQAWIRDNFSMDRVAQQYLAFYRQMLAS